MAVGPVAQGNAVLACGLGGVVKRWTVSLSVLAALVGVCTAPVPEPKSMSTMDAIANLVRETYVLRGDLEDRLREPVFKPGGLFRLAYAAFMVSLMLGLYWLISAGVDLIWPYLWP